MFQKDSLYNKKSIYQIVGVPIEKQGGNWDTGYTTYGGNSFIFANIGIPGRTGHDYDNHWEGETLVWFGKTHSHENQPAIQKLLHPPGAIYIFTRTNDKDPFTFAGRGMALSHQGERPISIIWSFEKLSDNHPEEIIDNKLNYTEGATITVVVNRYERSDEARTSCIDIHGIKCAVCGFDFENVYGEIGNGFIHVHHRVSLAEVGREYKVNPELDLVPVCPNCHAMLHRRIPAYSVEELQNIMKLSAELN